MGCRVSGSLWRDERGRSSRKHACVILVLSIKLSCMRWLLLPLGRTAPPSSQAAVGLRRRSLWHALIVAVPTLLLAETASFFPYPNKKVYMLQSMSKLLDTSRDLLKDLQDTTTTPTASTTKQLPAKGAAKAPEGGKSSRDKGGGGDGGGSGSAGDAAVTVRPAEEILSGIKGLLRLCGYVCRPSYSQRMCEKEIEEESSGGAVGSELLVSTFLGGENMHFPWASCIMHHPLYPPLLCISLVDVCTTRVTLGVRSGLSKQTKSAPFFRAGIAFGTGHVLTLPEL